MSSRFPIRLRRYLVPALAVSAAVLGIGCSLEPDNVTVPSPSATPVVTRGTPPISAPTTPPSATSRLFPPGTLPTPVPTRVNPNYGGHYFSSSDPDKLIIFMKEPSQQSAEELALQLVGPDRFNELTEVQALPGMFPLRLRRIWHDQLWEDAPNIKDILIRYRVTGPEYGMFEFQNTSHHDRIIARVNRQENMELFIRVVRNRMVLLGIPQGAVEFDLAIVITPAAPPPTSTPPPTATPAQKLCGEHIPKNTAARWEPGTDAYWDLRLLDLAPGYGGFFNNEDGSILYVYMLDTSQKQIARQAFEQFRPDLISEGLEFRILQGQYDMEQLHRWKSCIQGAENSGDLFFSHVAVRDEANRVFICLFEHTDERLIRGDSQDTRNELQEIGVPLEAVLLQRGITCQPQT